MSAMMQYSIDRMTATGHCSCPSAESTQKEQPVWALFKDARVVIEHEFIV